MSAFGLARRRRHPGAHPLRRPRPYGFVRFTSLGRALLRLKGTLTRHTSVARREDAQFAIATLVTVRSCFSTRRVTAFVSVWTDWTADPLHSARRCTSIADS